MIAKKHRQAWLSLLLLLLPGIALASLDVVATTTSMGMLVKEIGGDRVTVKTLAAPDRDTHYLQAKPSMMLALRRADLVVAVGADLEIGWLPSALQNSANPKVRQGNTGYFEAALHTELKDKGVADRSLGDVHPAGNPHFNLDPMRMGEIAVALAKKLGALDKENADYYAANQRALTQRLTALTEQLKLKSKSANGVLLMHNGAKYLLDRLGVVSWGFMEPVPGIPPTASHIKSLRDRLKTKQGVIIYAPYHQQEAPNKLAKELNWPSFIIPIEPAESSYKEYEALMVRWANALAEG